MTLPSNIEEIGQVSCGSASACAAAAFDFAQGGGPFVFSTHNAGGTWSLHRVPARPEIAHRHRLRRHRLHRLRRGDLGQPGHRRRDRLSHPVARASLHRRI